jgi:hypothetical protein
MTFNKLRDFQWTTRLSTNYKTFNKLQRLSANCETFKKPQDSRQTTRRSTNYKTFNQRLAHTLNQYFFRYNDQSTEIIDRALQ